MAVILTFVLVLWAWSRFELFAICIGHGNASKIDFRFDGYFDVAAYPRMIENLKTLFPGRRGGCGLHNRYYLQPVKNTISKGFCC